MARTGTTKATFVLPRALMEEIRSAVSAGHVKSASSFVREAIARQLADLRERRIKKAFEDAARDPEFMRDLQECMDDFAPLDSEVERRSGP